MLVIVVGHHILEPNNCFLRRTPLIFVEDSIIALSDVLLVFHEESTNIIGEGVGLNVPELSESCFSRAALIVLLLIVFHSLLRCF